MVPPVDGHNTTGQFIPADHGNGPIEVSLPNFPSIIDHRIVNTAKSSIDFPFSIDLQSGNSTGVGTSSQHTAPSFDPHLFRE